MADAAAARLSVIVPMHDAAALLDASLGALRASDLPPADWELIVVDDASADDTAERAAAYADAVIRSDAPARGPAYARNLGSEAASGDILVFIDADVRVHGDTLRRLRDALVEEPAVTAVFGAYDTTPVAPGTVSQYRNLVHHYVHARRAGEADTFWAGCGAIRRRDFLAAGGFDAARYPRPRIEDIELGYRLRARGCRILLRPEIQATHLKRWTLGNMVRSDVFDRGVPWARLLLEQRGVGSGSLNVRLEERLLTAVTATGAVALLAAPLLGSAPLLGLAAACLLLLIAANARLFRWFSAMRGRGFALRIVPLRVLYYLLNVVALGIALVQHLALRLAGRSSGVTAPRAPRDGAALELTARRSTR